MKKILTILTTVMALAICTQAQLPGSKTVTEGTFFHPTNSGAGFTILIGDSVTNLPTTAITNVSVSGAEDGMAIGVDLVGGVGTTNGILQLGFGFSLDGTTWTTPTNLFVVRAPVSGTTRVTWVTNVPATALYGASMMRLQQVASTNTSAYTITNVTYRIVQRRY